MQIINLTQHSPTPEQIAAGVGQPLEGVSALLTFNSLPSNLDMRIRAEALADKAYEAWNYFDNKHEPAHVLIGGAPYFMRALEDAIHQVGFHPIYSFSERVSEEQAQPDGSVRKVNVFKHVGFVGTDK